MVSSTNVISRETKITGDISAAGNIRIEGQLEGLVESKTKIVVGDSALIKGNITAPEAEISGKIDGEVFISGTLYLTKTAIINGNITAQKLIVENGAVFNGKCQMMAKGMVVSKNSDAEDKPQKKLQSV